MDTGGKRGTPAHKENTIKKEIVKNYRLRYSEYLGFYEYEGGVWERRTDTEVKKYIADALGQYQTGTRLNSILKLVLQLQELRPGAGNGNGAGTPGVRPEHGPG